MEKDSKLTRVVFRHWRPAHETDLCKVIALFPDIDAGSGHCSSYEHVGQHGGADYAGVIENTRPATPKECADLKAELEQRGYNLKVALRR